MAVPAVEYRELSAKEQGKTSAEILEDLNKARKIQKDRFKKLKIHNNAGMSGRHIRKLCEIDSASDTPLETAMEKLGLSARAHSRYPALELSTILSITFILATPSSIGVGTSESFKIA